MWKYVFLIIFKMQVGARGIMCGHFFLSRLVQGRYDLKEDQQLEMDRYLAKEREEAVKKARERRRAEIMVRLQTYSLTSSLFACLYPVEYFTFCFFNDFYYSTRVPR